MNAIFIRYPLPVGVLAIVQWRPRERRRAVPRGHQHLPVAGRLYRNCLRSVLAGQPRAQVRHGARAELYVGRRGGRGGGGQPHAASLRGHARGGGGRNALGARVQVPHGEF